MSNRPSRRRDDDCETDRQQLARAEQVDPFGVGTFDRMFREHEQAMDNMMEGIERDMSLATQAAAGDDLIGGMLSTGQHPQQGQYSSQVYVSSSRRGPDGKTVTEQYQSSTVGDADRKLREQQELYANSGTGIDKMALERTMGEQGRRVVRSRNRNTGDQNTQDMLKGGLTEENAAEFDQRWQEDAVRHLPPHGAPGMPALGGAHYSGIEDAGDRQSRRRSHEQRQLTGI